MSTSRCFSDTIVQKNKNSSTEAGRSPASPTSLASHPPTDILSYTSQSETEHCFTENKFLNDALSTTVNQAHIFSSLQHLRKKNLTPAKSSLHQTELTQILKNSIFFSHKLWKLLTYPYSSQVRNHIIQFISYLDKFQTLLILPNLNSKPSRYLKQFRKPNISVAPSIIKQVSETTITKNGKINPFTYASSLEHYHAIQKVQ